MASSEAPSDPSTDIRTQLQTLLDEKEKQLQLAGTLGQRILAQQMELEERIQQLTANGQGTSSRTPDPEGDPDMYRKQQDLAKTMQTWDAGNEQLWGDFGQKIRNGSPGVQPPKISLARSPLPDPEPLEPDFSLDSSVASDPPPTRSSRGAKNAAHRANDVEFAFEIGSSLLTEVRRFQSLLGERDKFIQDMKTEKDDAERHIDSLRTSLHQQEASVDKFKEENWNLEVQIQEARVQQQESQQAAARADSEVKRMTRQLAMARGSSETQRNDAKQPSQQAAPSALRSMLKPIAEITADDINAAKRCGGGGFGDVYVLTHAAIGKLALKRIRISGNQNEVDSQIRRSSREAEVWRKLNHPNILPFLDILERSGYIYLVSPFVQNGSLSDFTQQHPDIDRARLIQEAAAGIAYLHRIGIVHGDIKGANILVSDDTRSLLCDFGMARPQQINTSTAMQGIGTVRWQSPELLSLDRKTFKSDVWAFAMTIYEILSGHVPYYECGPDSAVILAVFVLKQRPPKQPETSPTGISYAALWEVAGDCWKEDPDQRPEIQEAHDRLILGGFRSLLPSASSVADHPAALSSTPSLSQDPLDSVEPVNSPLDQVANTSTRAELRPMELGTSSKEAAVVELVDQEQTMTNQHSVDDGDPKNTSAYSCTLQ